MNFDVCNNTAGRCDFSTTATTTTLDDPISVSEQVSAVVIAVVVLGGVAGIAGLVVGILCCWKCWKRKRDQMVSKKRDLGAHNCLMFCCLTFIEIGLGLHKIGNLTLHAYLTSAFYLKGGGQKCLFI